MKFEFFLIYQVNSSAYVSTFITNVVYLLYNSYRLLVIGRNSIYK